MRISTVILNVGEPADLKATRRWYEDILGLSVESEITDHSVWYRAGAMILGLHVGVRPSNPEDVCIGFEVDDVDKLFGKLGSLGVQFDGAPVKKSWGARAVSTRDPIGYTFTFATPD